MQASFGQAHTGAPEGVAWWMGGGGGGNRTRSRVLEKGRWRATFAEFGRQSVAFFRFRVPWSPLLFPGVHPSLGDILETALGSVGPSHAMKEAASLPARLVYRARLFEDTREHRPAGLDAQGAIACILIAPAFGSEQSSPSPT